MQLRIKDLMIILDEIVLELGWARNPVTGVLIRREGTQRDRKRLCEDRAEIVVMSCKQRAVRDCQQPSVSKRQAGHNFPRASRGNQPWSAS